MTENPNGQTVAIVVSALLVSLLANFFINQFGILELIGLSTYDTMQNERIDNIGDGVNSITEDYNNGIGSGGTRTQLDNDISNLYDNVKTGVVQVVNNSIEGSSVGSGYIYRKEDDGSDYTYYLITNEHVVSGMDTLEVNYTDPSVNTEPLVTVNANAELVGKNPTNDIAVVKFTISNMIDLHVNEFASRSNINIGQIAVAIGSPLGIDYYNTVSQGVVSGLRTIDFDNSGNPVGYVQTDASINSGNSGGALYNLEGKIIGTNVSKISETGSGVPVTGMNFAVDLEYTISALNAIDAGANISSELAYEDYTNFGAQDNAPTMGAKITNSDLGLAVGDIVYSIQSGGTTYTIYDRYDLFMFISTNFDKVDFEFNVWSNDTSKTVSYNFV